MERVVVTGGAGFLGSHLCQRLLETGFAVVAVDNSLTSSGSNVSHLIEHPRFQLINLDVSEGLRIDGAVDQVFHLASPASPIDYLRLPIETLRVGSIGTFHALDLAREHGARFLLASTSEAYGDPQVNPQLESYWGHVNPVGPRGVYDESKRYAEALTMAYRRTYGVHTSIARIFNTYGERMRSNDGRAIPTFICQALRGDPITVSGDGTQTRSMCYVKDMIDGLTRLLWSGIEGPVNLGNPRETSLLALAELTRSLAGSDSTIRFIRRPVDDPTVRRPDIGLARRVLDWEPKVDLKMGLLRTIGWFRKDLGLV